MPKGKYVRTEAMRQRSSSQRIGQALRPIEERFWSKVDRRGDDECWPWTGARSVQGYGKLFAGRSPTGAVMHHKAHRLSWEIANDRAVPEGRFILHSCDNRPCVNPRHLREGDHDDNMRDRAVRGRGKQQLGEASPCAKLTETQVRQIIEELRRFPRRSQAAIAADFGIKQPQVSRIMHRKSWPHLGTT